MILLAAPPRQEIFRIKVRDGLFRYRYLGDSLNPRRHHHRLRTAPVAGDRPDAGEVVPRHQASRFRFHQNINKELEESKKQSATTDKTTNT